MVLPGSPRCWRTNILDCDVVVCLVELQPCYYVHFGTNTPHKSPIFPHSYVVNSSTTVLLLGWLWNK